MNEIAAYLVKFSISLSLVTLFYIVFLRRLTFYNWNRWYLLVYPLSCFVLPLLDIGWWMEKGTADFTVLQQLPALGGWTPGQVQPAQTSYDFWQWALLILLVGSFIMVIRLLAQYWSFRRLSKKAVWLGGEEVKLFAVKESIIPFSFGRSVFINPSLHSEGDLHEIIRHELVHVRQHHTADMMLSELLLVVNWFNPFAWLLRHAIRQNLEFIADRQVLEHGIDRKQYQYLLVKVVGQRNFSMASHLNFSALKTRIAMMNKIRSARIQLIKFAFAVPLAAVILLAFRKKENPEPVSPVSVENVPVSSGSPLFRMAGEDQYPGLVGVVTDTVPAKQQVYVAGPNKKKYRFSISTKNGITRISVLDNRNKVVETVSMEEWMANEAAMVKKYGELPPPPPPAPPVPTAGAPVAPTASPTPPNIKITTVPTTPVAPSAPPVPPDRNSQVDGKLIIGEGQTLTVVGGKDVVTTTAAKVQLHMPQGGAPLYFVDGKEWPSENVSLIDPNRIKSINVLKGENATLTYGERGKDGVIHIVTKPATETAVVVRNQQSAENLNKTDPVTVVGYGKPAAMPPVYIVDGKEMTGDEFKKINPETIESISVWKGEKAIEKYGEKGKYGVLDITLKKQ